MMLTVDDVKDILKKYGLEVHKTQNNRHNMGKTVHLCIAQGFYEVLRKKEELESE